jgi:Fe2+ transport system protein B
MKYFERDQKVREDYEIAVSQQKEIEQLIQLTEKLLDDDSETILVNERYEFITQLCTLCVVSNDSFQLSMSDKIRSDCNESLVSLADLRICDVADLLLAIQTVGTMGTDWINDTLFGTWLPEHVGRLLAEWQVAGWMQELILNGIIAGVGASVRISTAIDYIVFMLELSGRLRIYGEDRFCHGSTFQEIRSFRKILHSYADCYRMWSARRHGQSHD